MPYTIQYWQWQYRVKANAQLSHQFVCYLELLALEVGIERRVRVLLGSQRRGVEEFAAAEQGWALAFTRYCHHQYRVVYGIKREGRWAGVYCAMVVQ